ncbi:MAG TPA: hypothetical protein VKX46_21210, partial [Ktedonobacteraceae bacterium]|nr:hypothetical protein [Ktedonobacteraceae bacterium]
MSLHHANRLYATIGLIILSLLALIACAQPPSPATSKPTRTAVSSSMRERPMATSAPSPVGKTAPASYTAHLLLQGVGRPDDLAFDTQGRLLFSDEFNGTINRLNADGSVTNLLTDPAGPEGMVVRPDGTIIFAEQETNHIMSLAPGSSTPTLLRALPGTPSNAT